MSTSGHIAALVNPPGNPRASYRVARPDTPDPERWASEAEKHSDSWWPHYAAWLADRSGPEKAAPTALGCAGFAPVAPAPGSYVRER